MKKKRVETFRYVASPDRKIVSVVRLGWLAPARQLVFRCICVKELTRIVNTLRPHLRIIPRMTFNIHMRISHPLFNAALRKKRASTLLLCFYDL